MSTEAMEKRHLRDGQPQQKITGPPSSGGYMLRASNPNMSNKAATETLTREQNGGELRM